MCIYIYIYIGDMVIFGDYYGRCPKSFGHSHIIRIFLSWNPGFFGFNILRKPQVCENMCIEPISAWHLNNITNEKKKHNGRRESGCNHTRLNRCKCKGNQEKLWISYRHVDLTCNFFDLSRTRWYFTMKICAGLYI